MTYWSYTPEDGTEPWERHHLREFYLTELETALSHKAKVRFLSKEYMANRKQLNDETFMQGMKDRDGTLSWQFKHPNVCNEYIAAPHNLTANDC